MEILKIVQYNMQKNKNKVMTPLLKDAVKKKVHVLAIQELWQNSYMKVTYCLNSCKY